MASFQLSFNMFLEQIKKFKLTSDSLFKVKMDSQEGFYLFSFTLPQTQEEYVSVIRKEDLSDVMKSELIPVTIPARRISESMKSAELISKKLEELDAKRVSDIRQSI